jgi:hypothetical protein
MPQFSPRNSGDCQGDQKFWEKIAQLLKVAQTFVELKMPKYLPASNF